MKKMTIATLSFLPAFAFAHAGHDGITMSQGFWAGLLHPIMGLDHLIALAALGILLSGLSLKKSIAMGSVFLGLMAMGFYGVQSNLLNLGSGMVEGFIIFSVGLSVTLLLLSRVINIQLGVLAVTSFAIFHGMAHGVEVPAAMSANSFALGFMVSCIAVLSIGRLMATYATQSYMRIRNA